MFDFPMMTFYIFSIISIASALLAVTAQDPVRAVLSLVLTFFSTAVLWLLANAEFLALVLILVYVGAVMTLFLFVLMMLDLKLETMKLYCLRQLPVLILMVTTFFALMYVAVNQQLLHSPLMVNVVQKAANYSNAKALGLVLYTDYLLAFEAAGVLLLLGIVAAISLTHRPHKMIKRQEVGDQIQVSRDDRVRLVNIPSEED